MNTVDKEKWDKIIQKYISCDCGEIYLSRNLTAPDCPYHSNDWESPMEEFLKELKEQQAEQIRLYEKTLDITTDQLMGVQAEINELKEKGLRWVNCSERLPTRYDEYFIKADYKATGIFADGQFWSLDTEIPATQWLEETPAPSEEAALNIKP